MIVHKKFTYRHYKVFQIPTTVQNVKALIDFSITLANKKKWKTNVIKTINGSVTLYFLLISGHHILSVWKRLYLGKNPSKRFWSACIYILRHPKFSFLLHSWWFTYAEVDAWEWMWLRLNAAYNWDQISIKNL